eukprot:comp22353_c0_seq2/m.53928 comp22353_c0_seq2/g.53928  ORF comp22353_c0_seq2/g.53928 comp22353_c0_seq2/m.53928 type:complete len:571 (+) comp22353_c0_seq2:568-2280(+)
MEAHHQTVQIHAIEPDLLADRKHVWRRLQHRGDAEPLKCVLECKERDASTKLHLGLEHRHAVVAIDFAVRNAIVEMWDQILELLKGHQRRLGIDACGKYALGRDREALLHGSIVIDKKRKHSVEIHLRPRLVRVAMQSREQVVRKLGHLLGVRERIRAMNHPEHMGHKHLALLLLGVDRPQPDLRLVVGRVHHASHGRQHAQIVAETLQRQRRANELAEARKHGDARVVEAVLGDTEQQIKQLLLRQLAQTILVQMKVVDELRERLQPVAFLFIDGIGNNLVCVNVGDCTQHKFHGLDAPAALERCRRKQLEERRGNRHLLALGCLHLGLEQTNDGHFFLEHPDELWPSKRNHKRSLAPHRRHHTGLFARHRGQHVVADLVLKRCALRRKIHMRTLGLHAPFAPLLTVLVLLKVILRSAFRVALALRLGRRRRVVVGVLGQRRNRGITVIAVVALLVVFALLARTRPRHLVLAVRITRSARTQRILLLILVGLVCIVVLVLVRVVRTSFVLVTIIMAIIMTIIICICMAMAICMGIGGPMMSATHTAPLLGLLLGLGLLGLLGVFGLLLL